ncbi:MAG: guanine deaminase [Candidatus Cloacimonadota bacterium]|nr:MAG: guanine deaminase [Candidatus Cloacimonadota bacterium]
MMQRKIIKSNFLTPLSSDKAILLRDKYLIIDESGQIENITDNLLKSKNELVYDFSSQIIIPGLIDIHIHFPQLYSIGQHCNDLLKWLNNYIFDEERKFANNEYAKSVSEKFFANLLKHGTTTAVVYSSIHKDATDIAFQTAKRLGNRVFIGKMMMDQNCPYFLKENTDTSIAESIELYEKWNGYNDRLYYIFSPRFAICCSMNLMKNIGKFIHRLPDGVYVQTHLSEDKSEIQTVKRLFPKYPNYTSIYEHSEILTAKTIVGHTLHLSEEEFRILQKYDVKIAHCPDANFFLKTGSFPYQKIVNYGLLFGLGSDIGAGTNFSIFYIMKMMNYTQKEIDISPEIAFYYATLGGAKCLSLANKIGSIEVGKIADLVLLKLPDYIDTSNEHSILSYLSYQGGKENIDKVMIAGEFVK